MMSEEHDKLKLKARAAVGQLHRLMQAGDYEAAYLMINDEAPLKHPKAEAVGYLQRIIELGALNNLIINRESVAETSGRIQVHQDFTVEYERDTTDQKRYELLTWRMQPDEALKLWIYINCKGED